MNPAKPGIRLPPIGFWSYARQDDDASEGGSQACARCCAPSCRPSTAATRSRCSRTSPPSRPGAEWEAEIRNALDRSTFFIPIITPNFVESEWCMREVQIFLERETALNALHPELAGRRRIFPVSYVPIDEADPFDPRIMGELRKLQWFDFTGLRFKEQHDEKVRTALSNLASGICRLINARVETPLTAAERDEAERRRADEAQARGKLEEADRLVREEEAERRRLQLEAEAEQRRAAELERARLAAEQARLAAEQAEAERLRREEEEKTRRERRGEGWDKDKRRMLVGAGCLALVLGVLAAIVIAPRLDSNRDAKAALAAITDKDWSTTSGVNLTAKGLKLATLAQMQKLADTGDAKAQTFMGWPITPRRPA